MARRAQAEWDDKAFRLQDEYDAAAKKAEETGSREDQLAVDRLHHQLIDAQGKGNSMAEIIRNLQSPGEHERRVQDKTDKQASLRRLTGRSSAMPKETAKDQGVPDVYLNDSGNFRIGMDARLKSDLVLSALGQITKDNPGASLTVFEPKEALALLEKRGWMSFHDRKKQLVEQAAAAKAEAAEKREAAAREKADAKAKKDAEKAAAKAEADAKAATEKAAKAEPSTPGNAKEETGTARPDPKPQASGRSRARA